MGVARSASSHTLCVQNRRCQTAAPPWTARLWFVGAWSPRTGEADGENRRVIRGIARGEIGAAIGQEPGRMPVVREDDLASMVNGSSVQTRSDGRAQPIHHRGVREEASPFVGQNRDAIRPAGNAATTIVGHASLP